MSFQKPQFRHPQAPTNAAGFSRKDYEGVASTLCAGCGHDSITNAIIDACFESNIKPHGVAKISGIGCSSKTPTYFLSKSHGFNSVHGRMPSVATGAHLANRDLQVIGISGDGDSASIGMGQFAHVIRRNLDMTYIIMNNGCYGLTKGQDSATADLGSRSRKGKANPYQGIDLCELALSLGAGFVARSFSGDKTQLVPLLKAAYSHRGLALIDVISPCVTFNNNPESTRSYDYIRRHKSNAGDMSYIPHFDEIDLEPTATQNSITLHDGSQIVLKKNDGSYKIDDRLAAMQALMLARQESHILTGLLYHGGEGQSTHQTLTTCQTPLYQLNENELCPPPEKLTEINNLFR